MNKSLAPPRQSDQELSQWQRNFTSAIVDYIATLHKTGKIGQATHDYLVSEAYASSIEQMIERQIESKLGDILAKNLERLI